jgi:hypothetical protein
MTSLQTLINPTADIYAMDAYTLELRQARDWHTFTAAAQLPWTLTQMKADSLTFWRLSTVANGETVELDGLVLAEVCRAALAFERNGVR